MNEGDETSMTTLPFLVAESFKSGFGYPQTELYGMVATSFNEHPHIRTMKLYEITSEGHLVFLTRTDTQKWHNLQHCPYAAVCFLNLSYCQILVEGSVELLSQENDVDMIRQYWQRLPPGIQEIYLYDIGNHQSKLEIPENFGAIFIIPSLWEVMEFNKEEYIKSTRKQFQLVKGSWIVHDLVAI